jgi:hypothetical protein
MNCFLMLAISVTAGAQPQTSRDPWLWPFASTSIWNMPIGSGAKYVPAGLKAAPHIGLDEEWMIITKASDPIQPIYAPSSWQTRWPGNQSQKLGEMRVPDSLIIEDARQGYTPNACSAFLQPDGRTVKQLEPTCRVVAGAQIIGYIREDQDLFGPGILGSHWGSGLSTIGGSIRLGELIGPAPIRHAIKLNVWGDQLYYGPDRKGFRWPADRSDASAPTSYKGKNPKLVMGTLLALSPDLTPEKLGVKSPLGMKLFRAFQDYGAYISDDSGWDHYDLCAEVGVKEQTKKVLGVGLAFEENDYLRDLMAIITKLSIVDNNDEKNIGGGGTPRRVLAPPIKPRAGV